MTDREDAEIEKIKAIRYSFTCMSTGSPYARRSATISTGRPRGVPLIGVNRECNDIGEFTFNFDNIRHLPKRTMSSI